MRIFIQMLFIIIFARILVAGELIPIPDKQVPYTRDEIISDPNTGEKVVCNQILVVFKEQISRKQQEKVLADIRGKVVGGIPRFKLYQIKFENNDKSFKNLAAVQQKLDKNNAVLYAMSQKLENSGFGKTKDIISSSSVSRSGDLNVRDTRRKGDVQQSSNAIYDVIRSHNRGLYACVEKEKRIVDHFKGKIDFSITITPEGEVKAARVIKSTIKNKRVIACLLNKIRKWRDFPRRSTRENLDVQFPLEF